MPCTLDRAPSAWHPYYVFNLKCGVPSHDTFRRVFMILNPEDLLDIFIKWVQAITKDTDLKQICIDGNSLRKSFEKGKASSAIHMINAWSTGASLSLGQLCKKCHALWTGHRVHGTCILAPVFA